VTDKAGDISNAASFSVTSSRPADSAFVVNTTADQLDPYGSSTVSLRDLFNRINSTFDPVTIKFDPTVFAVPRTIILGSELDPASNLTIQGSAAGVTLVFNETPLPYSDTTGITVPAGITLALSGISLSNPGGIGIINSGTLALGNCTVFDSNIGVIADYGGTASFTNSTFSGNDIAVQNNSQLALINCTISQNSPGNQSALENGGSLTLGNTIISGNQYQDFTGPTNTYADLYSDGSLNSLGNNFIGTFSPSTIDWLSSDVTGNNDPRLSTFGNYGGPTPTMVPVAGSPLLAAGNPANLPAGVSTDQRGLPRIVKGQIDIGAVEVTRPAKITVTPPANFTHAGGGNLQIPLGSISAPGIAGPFFVDVNWGDGSPPQYFSVSSAGKLPATQHFYASLGNFTVSVGVTDSAGDLASGGMVPVTFTVAPLRTLVVNTPNNQTDPPGAKTLSLSDAINIANASFGPVAITFDPTVFASARTIKSAITLTTNVFGNVTITAPSAGLTLTGGVTNVAVNTTFTGITFTIAGITNQGTLSLLRCAVLNSTGVLNDSAGFDPSTPPGIFTAINTTFSGNSTSDTGAIDNESQATLFDCTIVGNTDVFPYDPDAKYQAPVYDGAGVFNDSDNGATLTMGNTIVAGNHFDGAGYADDDNGDIYGQITSLGNNLVQTPSSSEAGGLISSDLIGLDAQLGHLASNGGPTKTLLPLPDSLAVGAGSTALLPGGTSTDQRGLPRTVNGHLDIGAVQTSYKRSIVVTPPANQQVVVDVNQSMKLGSFTAPGGKGPFTVYVNWGDGTPISTYTQTSAGTLAAQSHRFLNTGTLHATITIGDAAGNASVITPFTVIGAPQALKTIVVNTVSDQTDPAGSKTVSLRDAIAQASAAFGPVAISFDLQVFATGRKLILQSSLEFSTNHFGLISVTAPAAGLVVTPDSGGFNQADFTIDAGVSAEMAGVTMRDAMFGESVSNAGTLTLDHCTISGGGGVYNNGILSIDDSLLSQNDTAISNDGTLTLTRSTLTQNGVSPDPNDNFVGPVLNNDGIATLIDDTIANNMCPAISNVNYQGTGQLTVADCTIVDNHDQSQYSVTGGIANGGTLTLSNSIVAGNFDNQNNPSDITGNPIDSLGHNLIGVADGVTGLASSDLTGTASHPLDPKSAPLNMYGGSFATAPLLAGSPAIGKGSVALLPAGITTDERGQARVVNGAMDIGADQSPESNTLIVISPSAQTAKANVSHAFQIGSFSSAGMLGPYHVLIDWGDSSARTDYAVSSTGSLGTSSHAFASGVYTVTIVVVDRLGNLSNGGQFSVTI
jgi:hypothetical protein